MPREFYKTIKFNNKLYTLKSMYDDTPRGFDRAARRINRRKNRRIHDYGFDRAINAITLYDDLNNIYTENIFD